MLLGRHSLRLFYAAEKFLRVACVHRRRVRSQYLLVVCGRFRAVALGLLGQAGFAEVHRSGEVVVGSRYGFVVEFHSLGIVLLLDGDVTLQPVVLGVDQCARDTLYGRIPGQEFGGILQVAGLQVTDAGVVFGKVARRGRAVLLDHLEESGAVGIAFKGSGQYKDIRADLNILQDITPQIEITSEDIGDDLALPPFPAYQPNAFTFKVKSNWDWTISVAENAWIEVTPSAGEADKEYVMTVKATSNLSLDERSASFSIISDEVLGTKAVKEIFVTQESLAEGGPLEGLDAPVKWFFNGASGTDYTVPKEQFEQNNKLMASSGVGYISYFHTFNSDGSLHPNSTRMIGGTGQPYVTGAWKGDYWLFEVPVKNFKSGTKVRFTGLTRISGTGQKYWSLQYMDGTSWKPATDTQTATVNGEQITYTHLVPTANMQIDVTMTFARGISDGSVKIRFYCEANTTGGTEPNGGTIRWASSADNGYNDSPVIQVVE